MSLLLINIVGHNGSGKTTIAKKLAENLSLSRVNGDDFRYFISENIAYFKDLVISMPNDRTRLLNPLVTEYRFMLAEILLKASQDVLFDGSGATKEERHILFSRYDGIRRVIIYCKLPEEELLPRLRERDKAAGDNNWETQYREIRIKKFETPSQDECDELLIYNQSNYEEIEQRLKELLG